MNLRRAGDLTALALGYAGAGVIGRWCAPAGSAASVVWPAAGIALAVLFVKGERLWPGVFAGSILVQLCFPHRTPAAALPIFVPVCVAGAVSLQAVVGSRLLRRLSPHGYPLGTVQNFLLLLAVMVVAVLVSPTLSVLAFCAFGVVPWQSFAFAWLRWWSSDLLGILIGAPAVLAFANSGFPRFHAARWVEFASMQLLLGFFGATIFGPLAGSLHIQIGFIGLALLVWAALRFGETGFSVGILILAAFVTWGTVNGLGPFALSRSLFTMQIFLAVAAGTGWILTALWADRTRLAQQLEARAEELELKVRERTATLLEAQESLARAQSLARTGSWERDIATGRIRWSAELYRIHGRDPGVSIPDELLDVHPDDLASVRQAHERASSGGESVTLDYRIVRADGAERQIAETVALQEVRSRRPRLLGTAQDITEYRNLEEQLRQSQKMEAIGRLAGGVAHDFNNLLTIILGNGSLLESSAGPNWAGRSELAEILKAAERAGKLTNQLLAFSRRQVMQTRVLKLAGVVTGMEPMLRRLLGEHIELRIAADPAALSIRADGHQLEQVVMNLAVNARDAMPSGGTLEISVGPECLAPAAAEDLGLAPGSYTMLSVADTGAGIEPQLVSKIFEPFFTTKPVGQGTGLGLSMVYGIVKQSGGGIAVESRPDEGTVFRIYFPAVRDAPPDTAKRRGAAPTIGGSERILVVEDETAVRALVRNILENAGYRVFEAAGGAEALEMASSVESVRLLITDVIMPGIDGTELAVRLSGVYPGLRVLYISGYTGDMLPEKALAPMSSGAFLRKPFAPEALGRAVRELLDRNQRT